MLLISINDVNKISYYIEQVKIRNLSKRQLDDIIKSNEYEGLDESTKLKLINKEKLEVKNLIPNPIRIKKYNNCEILSEKLLQNIILEDIENFMNELGNSFSFVASEYKIKFGSIYNYIDLLLYNIKFRCYVVVELKITELKKEHIGQIQFYVNYIDLNLRKIN